MKESELVTAKRWSQNERGESDHSVDVPEGRFRGTDSGIEVVDVVEVQKIAHNLQDYWRNSHRKSDEVDPAYYLAGT